MVDSPNDALQSHHVSGRNSPRGRVGEQKKKSQKNRLEFGWNLVGIRLEFGWNSVGIRLEFGWNSVANLHQGAGSVGKKDLKIPKLPYMAVPYMAVPCMTIALYGKCLVWQVP